MSRQNENKETQERKCIWSSWVFLGRCALQRPSPGLRDAELSLGALVG